MCVHAHTHPGPSTIPRKQAINVLKCSVTSRDMMGCALRMDLTQRVSTQSPN